MPTKVTKKKPTTKKKTIAKKAAAKKKAVTKKTASPKNTSTQKSASSKPVKIEKPRISMLERYQYVAEAAYYRAEARGFSGDSANDWLDAEAEIDALYEVKQ